MTYGCKIMVSLTSCGFFGPPCRYKMSTSDTVFELPGGWGLNPPTVFTTPLTHCQIMYRGSAIYYIYTLFQKNIPNIFDCNLKKNYQILIIFGKNIPETTCHSTDVQFLTSSKVCFCTTWENRTNEILLFAQCSIFA